MLQIDVHVVLRAGRSVERHYVMLARGFAERIELRPELLEQRGEILCVGRRRELPVDIEAIKKSRRGDSGRDVPLDEHVDARRRQSLAPRWCARGARKCGSV